VVLVLDEELCVGALLWPAAGRSSPLSFEEVTALRTLGDHLGAAIGAASQLARSRARELEAERAMAAAQGEADGLRATMQRDASRWRLVTAQLDRRARVACYSPAAQAALINAERFAATGLPVALVAAPGVDAVAWAAVVHRASPHAAGPWVVIDGTLEPAAAEPVERALGRWGDAERSPLVLARGGTLVLLSAQLLDLAVQRYVATGLPADTGLVVVLPEAPGELSQPSSIDAHLGERLRGRAVGLPVLADRAEDLRALALHQLARIGLELRGQPLGLSMRAQVLLNEHRWPANEAELDAVLLRAALATAGPVVDRAELALGLGVAPHGAGAWRRPG
jgi:DNA-binding NtrC family response regulator